MSDKRYCYAPDHAVLINLGNIRDAELLKRFECLHTTNRMIDCPYNLPISYEGYKALHQYVFQDVYVWDWCRWETCFSQILRAI